MREKLHELMKREGLKPSQLAEKLGINPAGISHILAGRNKPGFDLLQKILRCFPQVNPDWLLLDSDQIYRDKVSKEPGSSDQQVAGKSFTENAASETQHLGGKKQSNGESPTTDMNIGLFRNGNGSNFGNVNHATTTAGSAMDTREAASAIGQIALGGGGHKNVAVERIVIFYADQTFESFDPTIR